MTIKPMSELEYRQMLERERAVADRVNAMLGRKSTVIESLSDVDQKQEFIKWFNAKYNTQVTFKGESINVPRLDRYGVLQGDFIGSSQGRSVALVACAAWESWQHCVMVNGK